MVSDALSVPITATETIAPYLMPSGTRGDGTVFKRLRQDETGATAIEYGLIVALIAIVMVVALQSTGNSLSGTMTTASTAMAGN